MTDSAGLTGYAAAGYGADDVELTGGAGQLHRLTNDELQGVKTEVIVDVTIVDGDFAGTVCVYANTSNGALSSTGAVEIRNRIVHYQLPPSIKVQ